MSSDLTLRWKAELENLTEFFTRSDCGKLRGFG